MNFVDISKIRLRIDRILDQFFDHEFPSTHNHIYALHEPSIEQWCDMLYKIIIPQPKIIKPLQEPIKHPLQEPIKQPSIKQHQNLPSPSQSYTADLLIKLQNNHEDHDLLSIYTSDNKFASNVLNSSKRLLDIEEQHYEVSVNFPKNTFRKYCSYNYVESGQFVIAGGLIPGSNAKTDEVYLLSFVSSNQKYVPEIKYISNLLSPLSSHCSVYIAPFVYFLGGKKNEGIITRQCSKMIIQQISGFSNTSSKNYEISEIAALNYGAASFCATSWKDQYIYKIGGIGETFDPTETSPYIQRYHIQSDCWEVVNPHIMNPRSDFKLLIHSLAYCSNQDDIVIFGGFDLDRNQDNYAFIIRVNQEPVSQYNVGSQIQIGSNFGRNLHQLQCIGCIEELHAGGFLSNEIMVGKTKKRNWYAIQQRYEMRQIVTKTKPKTKKVLKNQFMQISIKDNKNF